MTASIRLAAVSISSLAVLAGSGFAEKITVGTGGIDTVQQAVDVATGNADPIDTILIPKGTYVESVVVNLQGVVQDKLIMRKTGKGKVTIRSANTNQAALRLQNAKHVEISNLTLDSGNAADSVSALFIDGQSEDIQVDHVNGVAGDDIGVLVFGGLILGVRFNACDFSDMVGVGFILDGLGHELNDCRANACGFNAVLLTDDALNCRIIDGSFVAAGGSAAGNPGVVTVRGNGHVIEKAEIGGGGINGLFVDGGGHVVKNCVSSGNVGAGFSMEGAQVFAQGCTATGNAIGLAGGGLGATIEGGKYNGNLTHGIEITQGGTNVVGITASNNGMHGILINSGVLGTHVRSSTFKKNSGEAIMVEGQLTWLELNSAMNGNGFVNLGVNNSGRDNKVDTGTNDF